MISLQWSEKRCRKTRKKKRADREREREGEKKKDAKKKKDRERLRGREWGREEESCNQQARMERNANKTFVPAMAL